MIDITMDGDACTAVITGRLDTVSAELFEQEMKPLLENADKNIVLDCSRLEYISSTGLRKFLVLRKTVADKNGTLIIRHINDELRNIFTITGFFSIFDIR